MDRGRNNMAPLDTSSDHFRLAMRQKHGVRPVESAEEGTAADRLPNGVYGFTGSPALASPLFRERRYRNFEVHRLNDGVATLIGFVTPDEARRLDASSDVVELTIYPDAEGESRQVVAIPYSRIVHHRQYSLRNSAGIPLQVRPAARETFA